MEDLKGIKNLENLETFKLINPTVITKDMNSDEGTIDPPMNRRKSFIYQRYEKFKRT